MAEPILNDAPPAQVNLRCTNPNLYLSLMTFAVIFTGLGVNFLFGPPPTFEQFGIPRETVGGSFLVLGLSQLVLLNFRRRLPALRISIIAGIALCLLWGTGTTETAFAGTSSFQLCVLYFGLTALQAPLLLAPFWDPITANGKIEEELLNHE